MASSPIALFAVLISIIGNFFSIQGKFIFEEGYTVTTVLNGHKLGFNPHSVLPLSGSPDLVILDSSSSTFYTVSFSNSPAGVIEKLSGNGVAGYSDGDLASAMFNKPRSFTIDGKNNVYVADKGSHTVRKISKSGVTTIAGGYTQKTGNADGPAQNASFSNDFELAFIPQRCALMISDRGNQLVRQINLKAEDCARGSDSVLGVASAWALGLGVACVFGLIVGFAARPYVLPYEGSSPRPRACNGTWKRCLINLGKQVQMICFDIRSVIASSNVHKLLRQLMALILSHLSLMFGLNLVKRPTVREKLVSLLDCDVPSSLTSSETTKSQMLGYQLEELVSLEGSMNPLDTVYKILQQADEKSGRSDAIFADRHGRIDNLIQANMTGFAEQGIITAESWETSPGF